MAIRFVAFFAILLVAGHPSPGKTNASDFGPASVVSAPCGSALPSGRLVEPPVVDVGLLPRNSLGRHELILRVRHAGPRFCYHYLWHGAQQNVAPTLVVRRGERFVLRLVNEISGPAAGATMSASALPRCMPMPMPDVKPQRFDGYLNHTMYARFMPMKPTDVNLHLHGFEGPAEQENIFLSTLSTTAHACEYDITIPRTQPPGTYFYHPHAHGMAGAEVGGGLTGMWIVQPDTPQLPLADQHVIILRLHLPLVLDDPAKGAARLVPTTIASAEHERSLKLVPGITSYDPFNPPPWQSPFPLRAGSASWDPHGCGRFATPLVSIDGVDAPARLVVPPDTPQLLQVLNATVNDPKYLRLRDASGKPQILRVVALDGIPISNDDAHPLSRTRPWTGICLVPVGVPIS